MAQSGSNSGNLFVEGGVGTLRLLAYLALATILMVADHRGDYLDRIRSNAGLLIGPIYRIAGSPARLARGISDHLGNQQALLEDNTRLRHDLLLTNARLDRLAGVQVENQRLRALLGGTRGLRLNVQLVSLSDVDLDPFRQRLVLDAGSRRGVETGMAVIDAGGVMGQVQSVTPTHSTVILVSDPSHAVPVQITRTGLRAIAYGTGRTDRLEIPGIPLGADVKVGDAVETSGIGGHFPAGFKVGTIQQLHPDDTRLFAVAEIQPSAKLDRGGEVLLVWNADAETEPGAMGPPRPAELQPDRIPEIEP